MGRTCKDAPTSAKPVPQVLMRQSHGPLPRGAAEQNPGQSRKVCVHKAVGCWYHEHPPKRRQWMGGYRTEIRVCRCETELVISQFSVQWQIRRRAVPWLHTGWSAMQSCVPCSDRHTAYSQLTRNACSISPAAKMCGTGRVGDQTTQPNSKCDTQIG